jgi:hypothetical protein
MSGVIQKETSIAAGATANLITGSTFEFARRKALVTIGVNAAATGTFLTIQGGPDIVLEESPCAVSATLGLFPKIPDDFYYNTVLMTGDRLVINARNPTGGAVIHRCIVQVQDLE